MVRFLFVYSLMSVLLLTHCGSAEEVVLPTRRVETLPPPQVVETRFVVTGLPLAEDVGTVTAVSLPTAISSTTSSSITQLSTATPQPSPTPVVYQVQEGDTLLDIALQHGATVAELEAVNPNLNPDLLSIGQLIQLPLLPTPLAQAVGETAVSPQLQLSIAQLVVYKTPVDSLWLLGEVLNEGEFPVESVQVTIDLLDAELNKLDSVRVWTAVSIIPPGGKVPFGVLIAEPPAAFAQPAATIVSGNPVVELGERYGGIEVLETAVTSNEANEPQSSPFQLDGKLQNSGEQSATAVRIVATFYNAEGVINGFQQQVMDDVISAGETVIFSFIAAPLGVPSNEEETITAAVITEAILFIEE